MSGILWWDVVFWFFAIAGVLLILCDSVQYFMYKNTLPQQMTVLIPADALRKNARAGVANLLNMLYEQNPDGNFEIIILDNTQDAMLRRELHTLADASDCLFIAQTKDVTEYITHNFQ